MTTMVVVSFSVAAVMALAGCLRSAWVRAWRRRLSPGAPELPDASFVLARVVFFALAGVLVFSGFRLVSVDDAAAWSDGELASAVEQAAYALDGTSREGDIYGDDGDFDTEYASMIEDKVVQKGGGDAPEGGVNAAPTGTNGAADARYTVTASGAEASYCLHVTRTHSKKDDWVSPGISGGDGVTVPMFRFAVTSSRGAC
ncbi:hypothetical protein [Streptomyces tropicalis]|uniref:Secreted protein n=1 Tax=Streptomyces tropicalis TaxID=3034234 RepID=A0ABT6ADD4_9ACTN|nr:hypothetical protein [Streptomyces tropicalis]MDF3302666.1 hypothetical protein [Streptomyces tropicalis]